MRFRAKFSTEDRRLTRGKAYAGQLLRLPNGDLRIAVYDDSGTWMTFNTRAFEPAKKGRESSCAENQNVTTIAN